jgi:hypothetical protein
MAFTIKQNDTSPSIQANLADSNSNPIDLSGASVILHMSSVSGVSKVASTMIISDAANGVVQYDWVTGDTDTVGIYYVEFQVTYDNGAIETFPNNGNIAVSVVRELN